MFYTEDELLPISALQHLMFCERQWALIHLEGFWEENRLTAEGNILHEKAHECSCESRGNLLITRGIRLRCLRLGLTGQADVVEFLRVKRCESAMVLPGREGLWQPVPVEYKRGRDKINDCDRIQLCAQALCLEEMLQVQISYGAIYYGEPRKRIEVVFDVSLRSKTEEASQRLHQLNDARKTPPAVMKKVCKNCSLINICMPKVTQPSRQIGYYLQKVMRAALGETEIS